MIIERYGMIKWNDGVELDFPRFELEQRYQLMKVLLTEIFCIR